VSPPGFPHKLRDSPGSQAQTRALEGEVLAIFTEFTLARISRLMAAGNPQPLTLSIPRSAHKTSRTRFRESTQLVRCFHLVLGGK
jgi:hypothetical protein